MIGKLKGKLAELDGNVGLIETASGVYYAVFLTPSLLKEKKLNDECVIYTFLQVKDNDLVLFGFEKKTEFQLFTMLLAVPGIGPKSAFSIISFAKAENIVEAISSNNVLFFSAIPGIGKKTAQKILLELAGKVGKEFDVSSVQFSDEDKTVIEALTTLGFKKQEAIVALSKAAKNMSIEQKIKEAIKMLTYRS